MAAVASCEAISWCRSPGTPATPVSFSTERRLSSSLPTSSGAKMATDAGPSTGAIPKRSLTAVMSSTSSSKPGPSTGAIPKTSVMTSVSSSSSKPGPSTGAIPKISVMSSVSSSSSMSGPSTGAIPKRSVMSYVSSCSSQPGPSTGAIPKRSVVSSVSSYSSKPGPSTGAIPKRSLTAVTSSTCSSKPGPSTGAIPKRSVRSSVSSCSSEPGPSTGAIPKRSLTAVLSSVDLHWEIEEWARTEKEEYAYCCICSLAQSSMRLPQIGMPESLRVWLENELKVNGIHANASSFIVNNILQHTQYLFSAEDDPIPSSLFQNRITTPIINELRRKLKDLRNPDWKTPGSGRNSLFRKPLLPSEDIENKLSVNYPPTDALSKFDEPVCTSACYGRRILGCSLTANTPKQEWEEKPNSGGGGRRVEGRRAQHAVAAKEEDKENRFEDAGAACGGLSMKMRSRSTVKQQQQHQTAAALRPRKSTARSLDRKDDTPRIIREKSIWSIPFSGKTRRLNSTNDPNPTSTFNCGVEPDGFSAGRKPCVSSACSIPSPGKAPRLNPTGKLSQSCPMSNFNRGGEAERFSPDGKALLLDDDIGEFNKGLAMDFEQLLDSPDNCNEGFYRGKQAAAIVSSVGGGASFIQCGTNITSSIWSENTGGLDVSMECVGGGGGGHEVANRSDTLFAGTLVGRSVWDSTDRAVENGASGIFDERNGEKKKRWSDGAALFANINPWKAAASFSGGNNECSSMSVVGRGGGGGIGCGGGKWSDIEGTSLRLEDGGGKFYSAFGGNGIDTSLSALNHNSNDSSFMEVQPTKSYSLFEKHHTLANKNNNNNNNNTGSAELKHIWENGNEDEDLLTSMRTHFQPIGFREVQERNNDACERRVIPSSPPKYEDGATFQINNSYEKLKFVRSESGALYLDSDREQKFREYIEPAVNNSSGGGGDFVPKFRVCRNEKFCQTDDDVETAVDDEKDVVFYFTGDKREAEDSVKREESSSPLPEFDTTPEKATAVITVDGFVTAWPASIWSNAATRSWCDVWSADVVCGDMNSGMGMTSEKDKRDVVGGGQEDDDLRMQMKEEIFEDGEELLSDLSSMQDLLLNGEEPMQTATTKLSSLSDTNKYELKLNSIPLTLVDVWKTNERHVDLIIAREDSMRQPLQSRLARTESAVIM